MNSQLLNRYSIRQILALVTAAAIAAAVLRQLRLENAQTYAFVLAPSILYGLLRAAGVMLRPAQSLARRPVAVLGVSLLAFVMVSLVYQPRALVALLPVAAFWTFQLVVIDLCESTLAGYMSRRPVAGSLEANARPRWPLLCICLLVSLSLLTLCLYGMAFYVIGKGTLFGKYWMVVSSGGITEYQWQNGFSDIDWQWTNAAGRATPATTHRDWQFLGLARYRVGSIEKLRVPLWLPIAMSTLVPAIWIARTLLQIRAASRHVRVDRSSVKVDGESGR
ncbi:MAG: hypothetical protein WD845_01365 [Pirellulales bacterium]